MKRYLSWVALATILLIGSASRAPGAQRPPNILLIVSDNQVYEDLGCFGNREIKTPRIDRLAAEGVRLTEFCVASSICTPSRGAFLTGRYPYRNGLYDMIRNDDAADYGRHMTELDYAVSPEMTLGLDLREVIIPQPLKQAGYATGVIGKWDSGRAKRFLPLQRGFDFFYGFANTGIDYWTHERYGIPSLFRNNDRIQEDGYATDLFCREALGFIAANRDRPFFLYLPFNACHGSAGFDRAGTQAPPETLALYPAGMQLKKKTRYACLTRMDEAIGKILDRLDAYKLADNTLVIFYSDNGRLHLLQQPGVRVAFVARWPGHIPPGTTSGEFVTSLEILPTILAAAGVHPPAGVKLDGYDMLDVLAGRRPSPRREMFWLERGKTQMNRAARLSSYVWIDSEHGKGLYDLARDPGQQHDLSTAEPGKLAELKSRFASWQQEMADAEPRGPFRNY